VRLARASASPYGEGEMSRARPLITSWLKHLQIAAKASPHPTHSCCERAHTSSEPARLPQERRKTVGQRTKDGADAAREASPVRVSLANRTTPGPSSSGKPRSPPPAGASPVLPVGLAMLAHGAAPDVFLDLSVRNGPVVCLYTFSSVPALPGYPAVGGSC